MRLSPAFIAAALGISSVGVSVAPGVVHVAPIDPGRSIQDPARAPGVPTSSTLAKLRDLFARRPPKLVRRFKGVGMSVAHGKRMARKRAGIRKHRQRIGMKA